MRQHLGIARRKAAGHPHFAINENESPVEEHRDVRINVVHIMKAPEKPNAVICDVPPIKCQVHQEESCSLMNCSADGNASR